MLCKFTKHTPPYPSLPSKFNLPYPALSPSMAFNLIFGIDEHLKRIYQSNTFDIFGPSIFKFLQSLNLFMDKVDLIRKVLCPIFKKKKIFLSFHPQMLAILNYWPKHKIATVISLKCSTASAVQFSIKFSLLKNSYHFDFLNNSQLCLVEIFLLFFITLVNSIIQL